MRTKFLVLALAAALTAALAATALAATKSVKVGDDWFVRSSGGATVTVKSGDRLKFRWTGDNQHNVKGRGISLGKKCRTIRTSGSCRTKRLRKKGTFTLFCEVHGRSVQSMRLRVR